MSFRDCRDDHVAGALRSAAEQHPRNGEPRRPERSPRSTSRSTSPSTTTCRRCWRRRPPAGASCGTCARDTTPGSSVTRGGAPCPTSSSALARNPVRPFDGVHAEGHPIRTRDHRLTVRAASELVTGSAWPAFIPRQDPHDRRSADSGSTHSWSVHLPPNQIERPSLPARSERPPKTSRQTECHTPLAFSAGFRRTKSADENGAPTRDHEATRPCRSARSK